MVFYVLSVLITFALFTLIYRVMPNGRVTLRDSVPGAVVAGLLWEAAKYVFASSLHYFHYDQIYGSVGAVVAVLTWSYMSSLILLFGSQLSVVFPGASTAHEELPRQRRASPRLAAHDPRPVLISDSTRADRRDDRRTRRRARRLADARR